MGGERATSGRRSIFFLPALVIQSKEYNEEKAESKRV